MPHSPPPKGRIGFDQSSHITKILRQLLSGFLARRSSWERATGFTGIANYTVVIHIGSHHQRVITKDHFFYQQRHDLPLSEVRRNVITNGSAKETPSLAC